MRGKERRGLVGGEQRGNRREGGGKKVEGGKQREGGEGRKGERKGVKRIKGQGEQIYL